MPQRPSDPKPQNRSQLIRPPDQNNAPQRYDNEAATLPVRAHPSVELSGPASIASKPVQVLDFTQSATQGVAPNAGHTLVTSPEFPEQINASPVKLSAIAQQVKACLDEYYSLMSAARVMPSAAKRAAELLSRASDLIVTNSTDEVLSLYWDFHVMHKNGVLHEKQALQGLTTLSARKAELVSTLYTAFRHYVLRDALTPGDAEILKVTRSQKLITFLKMKGLEVRPA